MKTTLAESKKAPASMRLFHSNLTEGGREKLVRVLVDHTAKVLENYSNVKST